VFDSIISTLKFSGTSASKIDSATGMFIYNNNGIRFEYPEKINTGYIGLNIVVSVKKADTTKLDSNGCYLPESNYGEKSATIVTINGIKFCSIVFSDVGAGQLGTDYGYVTFRDGNAYSIDYRVSSSNGCGAYQESNDLTAPENQRYNECLDAKKNYESLITKPIQNSISSFTFTN
jgi:hypothetical protein